jgi:type I restriction enzyme S subunit
VSWEVRNLAEVADFNLGKMLDQRKNRGELRPYLANVNVRWGDFQLDNLREMRFGEHELDRYGLRDGDIVMCEGGEPGRCAIWRDQLPEMMFQKALHRIRPHSCLDNQFLFYSFLQLGRADAFGGLFTGSTIKHLPKEKLAKLEVRFPPLAEQKRIAAILSAYDDLIENNRRRIALLEEAARQLYKEWFVRFRFPGHEHVKLIDGVPEGWSRQPIGSLVSKLGSGATPRGGEGAYRESGITLVRSQNVYDDAFHDDGLAYIDEQQAQRLANVTVQRGDILLNITGASVGRCCMVPDRHLPARVNQHVMIVRAIPEICSPLFLLNAINQNDNKEALLSIARSGGATREALTKDDVGRFEILLPEVKLIAAFKEFAAPCLEQSHRLSAMNAQLSRARDILLPRLMNGTLGV